MKKITMKFTGTSPILLSGDRLADPLEKATIAHKELTSKRKKTEEDHIAIARSQWGGLLYLDEKENIIMPTQNIRAAIVGGAKLNKLGMQVKRGTMMMVDDVPLDYGKKLTVDQLWEQRYLDRRSVVIGSARVMAYRPKFNNWSVIFDISQIKQASDNAGLFVGIGGFRPEKGGTFGRFNAEVIA